jgi:hypothetical protein
MSAMRRRRPLEGVHIMCAKYQRRCAVLRQIREEALQEWARAETFEEVCRCWARLGGRTTLHRKGPSWFRELAYRRWEKASRYRS